MEDRIVDLEIRIAYQERLIGDLDEVVRSFARRVEALERELASHRQLLTEHALAIGPGDHKPPHY